MTDYRKYFDSMRHDARFHVGGGDIRITMAMQDEIADEIERLREVLQKIANDKLEESSSKWKWQIQDHIRWAKEAIEK